MLLLETNLPSKWPATPVARIRTSLTIVCLLATTSVLLTLRCITRPMIPSVMIALPSSVWYRRSGSWTGSVPKPTKPLVLPWRVSSAFAASTNFLRRRPAVCFSKRGKSCMSRSAGRPLLLHLPSRVSRTRPFLSECPLLLFLIKKTWWHSSSAPTSLVGGRRFDSCLGLCSIGQNVYRGF